MYFKSRKFYVWLISLGAVLAIYLLVSRLSETPRIDIDTSAEYTDTLADSNVSEFGGEIGKIGDVGVGKVETATFTKLNEKTKEVEREFGFKKLLHEEGNEWEIKKPYMNIFQHDFICRIVADRGKVRVENAPDRPSPKDAKFTGNVVVHILPKPDSNIKESFIYLDDVVFISEKSQFSTAGPVKFVSEDAQMLGRGLELVYNKEADRLEFLKIIHLETLRLKTSQAALFSSAWTEVDRPAAVSVRRKTQQLAKPVPYDVPQKAKISNRAGRQVVEQREGEHYRCIFKKNVVVDTPQQLVFAADKLTINDIFWAKSSSKKSQNDSVKRSPAPQPQATSRQRQTASEEPLDGSDEELVDVVITCDDGIVVTPMSLRRVSKDFAKPGTVTNASGGRGPVNFDDTDSRPKLIAQKIDHFVSTGNTVAGGPLELTFHANDLMGAEPNEAAMPVKITAQKEARFLQALNQVIFEGNCLSTTLRENPNSQQRYRLSAPKLTVDLLKDKAKQSEADIKHLAAGGGVVQLDTSRWAGEELLGFTKLRCRKFDYDSNSRMFLATEGLIGIKNHKISKPEKQKKKLQKFSLQKQCWAVIEDFNTLTYFLDLNQIIADADLNRITVNYFPVVEGRVQYDQQATATAGHVEANLEETADGKSELSTLLASGGITYEDNDKQFEGGRLFFNADKSIVTVQGNQFQSCYFNGAAVDAIEWDLKKDKLKFKITGPGALKLKE